MNEEVVRMSDERIAKKIYDRKVSGKRGRRRPRRWKGPSKTQYQRYMIKIMRVFRRTCMKKLMTVDEAKDVCRDHSAPFSLTIQLEIQREFRLHIR